MQAPPPEALTSSPGDLAAPPVARRVAGVQGAGLIAGLSLLALAFWARLLGLDAFVTTDEVLWAGRSGNFAHAVAERRFDLTYQSGHPGVVTMWAGLLGMGSERAQGLGKLQRRVSRVEVGHQPDFIAALAAGRRVVADISTLAVAGLALLAWRLFGPAVALAGGTLLALDPFLVAHARVLHTDALLTSFMGLALVAGLARWAAGGGRRYLLLAGPATGLALLCKAPALFLLAFLPLLAILFARRRGSALREVALDLVVWAGLAAMTYVALWPALWVAPLETLRAVVNFIGNNADPRYAPVATESERGAAYFGAESGALFYPAAFALRTTPLVLLGLAWLVGEVVLRARRSVRRSGYGPDGVRVPPCAILSAAKNRGPGNRTGSRPAPGPRFFAALRMTGTGPPLTGEQWQGAWVLAALAVYAVLFGFAMTFAGKSFDRYLLPAFPAIDLLAGFGLVLAARRLVIWGRPSAICAGLVALALAIWPVVSSLPYGLTWYNPLLGGGPVAQRLLTVGWGEGLDRVAAYLNERPNAASLKVGLPAADYTAELYGAVLDAYFVGQVVPLEGGDPSAGGVEYLVTYGPTPRDAEPAIYDPRFQNWQPDFSLRLAGVEYGRVYASARGVPLGAGFGGVMLDGYGLDTPAPRPGRPIEARLFWREAAAAPPDARVVLTLTSPDGRDVARADAPLGVTGAGPAEARAYQLVLPNRIEPGEYPLWVALESPPGRTLPLNGRPAALAAGAPERSDRAVLRSVRVR